MPTLVGAISQSPTLERGTQAECHVIHSSKAVFTRPSSLRTPCGSTRPSPSRSGNSRVRSSSWTSGLTAASTCLHVLPDLKALEHKYREELVGIGVHSAKFTTEKETASITSAIDRYEIEHPVINDHDFQVWQSCGIRAWPSFVLINPVGRVVGTHSGEGIYKLFDTMIAGLVDNHVTVSWKGGGGYRAWTLVCLGHGTSSNPDHGSRGSHPRSGRFRQTRDDGWRI